MPASLKRIRETMQVETTARDKGLTLTLTLTVTAYDSGMVEVDGVPMSSPETGWLDAAEVAITTLNEFHRQVARRRK